LGPSYFRRLKDIFGIDIVRADSSDILKYYNQIEDMKAKNLASKFLESTQGILGTTEDEIIKATKLYLALKNLMEDYETNAVTAGCLPWIRQNLLPVSPCFAISKFNDEGIPAGCEADVESLITLCFCHYLAGRPGFMSDPVIDESTNRIIFAHCTASTRFLGYKQKPFPFWFRSHTESWRDVGIETEMKQKGEVTVLRLLGTIKSKSFCWPVVNVYNKFEGYNLLAYKAKTAEINKDIKDKEKRKLEWGCRTKVTLELPEEELRKFKENFYGHHRIILYGDYTKKLKMLARFLGIKFVNKMYLEFEI
jgi:L-fucose isomerase-like protein